MIKKSYVPVTQVEDTPNAIESAKNESAEIATIDTSELLHHLLVYPYGQPGHACKGLLDHVAQLLLMRGVSKKNIRAGQMVFLSMISVKMNRPFSTILQVQNDPAVAEHLISTCSRLVPQNDLIQLQGLSVVELYSAGDYFMKKALICRDLSDLKKIESDLMNLIIKGQTTIQAKAKSKYGIHMTDFNVLGPVAFVGIERENNSHLFDHPSILRIHIYDSHWDWQDNGGSIDLDSGTDFEMDRISEYIGTFHWKRVNIPYTEQLLAAILKQKPIHYAYKSTFICNLISICTTLNFPSRLNMAEFIAKLFNSQEDNVREWLKEQSLENESVMAADVYLAATKAEYCIVKTLLDEILPVQHQRPTSIRCQVFEIVKNINFAKLKLSTLENNDILEKLYILNFAEIYWAKIENIFKIINHSHSQIIPLRIIEVELSAMNKMGLIERKKFNGCIEYGYFITTLTAGDTIKFPAIDELFGACSEAIKVEVEDPY